MRFILLWVLLVFSASSFAADRTEKIKTLMEAQGLLQMFEQSMEEGKKRQKTEMQRMLNQVMGPLKPNKEFDVKFRAEVDRFNQALAAPWTAQEIVDLWAKSYGAHFTDAELDQLVAYYTSPLGKKDVAAAQAATPELSQQLYVRYIPVLERATADFIQRLDALVKECRCKK